MNLRTWTHLGWVPGCLVLLGLIGQSVSSETRVVCYYTNWSVYRPGTAKFSPQNINPYLCTHLIYAFGGFTKENSLKPFDKYQDIEKGGYAKFTGLKTYNKNLKTMLAIGGWNEGSSRFSPMVANAERRKELVRNSIKFLRQNHFDGLDLDWEYPSFRDGGKARDRDNYAQLVQELREEFDRESEKTGRPRLLLTMAVPAGIEYINKGYDVPKLNKYLDWMNILSYDYHSAFEPAVNHHSPLFPIEEDDEYNYDGDLNIDHTIKHYLKAGAEPNKLVLGIPTYGRSYTLFNPDANELGAPADGPGDMGDATRENGYLAYYEICENLKENNWQIVQPNPDAMGPYAFKDNQWVSYDDELIVRKKSEYVVEHNLGGIMFWSIDNDDFRGNCNNKPYPLIEAAKDALLTAASGKTDDNLVSAPSKTRKPITRTRTRPSSTADNSVATSRVQNSGGRQTFEDTPSASSGRKRVRPGTRAKPRSEDAQEETKISRPTNRQRSTGRRRKTTTTAAPTTRVSTSPSPQTTTPSWKTPEPPTTPDPGGDFKCEEDGFFRHPRDCKKYFWCLSGPADLGIIAHQFTCPAGLYFNKAADSCDYSQNVLCNKQSKATTTTTTTTTTSTTPAPTFSTTRRISRITAATSRTTFAHTTTTTEEPEYYDEYEYEDDEFEESPKHGIDPEEDPRVIKELVDLIKKVGGIEELEKYLKVQEDGTMGVTASDITTPATISRSLYERVLSRANVKSNSYKPNSYKPNSHKSNSTATTTSRGGLTYSTLNRNRGPQSQTIDKPEVSTRSRGLQGGEKSESSENAPKGKPQYTTISRNRPSVEKTVEELEEDVSDDDEDDDDEDQVSKTRQFISRQQQNQPEYVTIRRQRPSAATDFEEETTTKSNFRSSQRGVPGEDVVDEVTETSGAGYVTVQRPSAEVTTTSKYSTILRRRPATESPDDSEESTEKEIIQRRPQVETKDQTTSSESPRIRSTTEAPEVTTEEKRYRSTTLDTTTVSEVTTEKSESILEKDSNQLSSDDSKVNIEETTVKEEVDQTTIQESKVTTIQGTTIQSHEVNVTTVQDSTDGVTETPTDATNQISDSSANSDIVSEVAESVSEKTPPTLFRPRPFATRGRPTTPKSTEVVTKMPARPFFFRRPNLKITPGATAVSTSTTDPATSRTPLVRPPPRRRFTTAARVEGSATTANQVVLATTSKPRYKFASRRPFLRTTTPTTATTSEEDPNDQILDASNQKPMKNGNLQDIDSTGGEISDSDEIPDIALTIHSLNTAPLPTTRVTSTTEKTSTVTTLYDRIKTRKRGRISTTIAPQTSTVSPSAPVRRRRPQPFEKVTQVPMQLTTGSYTPITVEYDYYDEGDVRILGQLPANSKVLIHSSGAIQCLDQGNFPHPVSCRKFISCAKMENNDVIGWEYTCPSRLSFDPVGGICNWSAGLGCNEN